MWVEYFINHTHKTSDDFHLEAEKDGEKWVCEIELPLIKKIIRSTSFTEIGAILRTADKAAKLINEYIEKHPTKYMWNRFKHGHWEILTEDGITYKRINPIYKQKLVENIEKMSRDSMNAVKKCINTLRKINGSTNDLFIHVLNESLFSEGKTEEEMILEMNEKLQKDYDIINMAYGTCKYDGNLIIAGTTAKLSELNKIKRRRKTLGKSCLKRIRT